MSLEAFNPKHRFEAFRNSSNRMWEEFIARWPRSELHEEPIGFIPEVDFVETQHDIRFYLSIPGMVEDDIVIEVGDDFLIVRGERHAPYDANFRDSQQVESQQVDVQSVDVQSVDVQSVESRHADNRLREWRYGYFERKLELISAISVEDLRATYQAGVLTIVAIKLDAGPSCDAGGFPQSDDSGDQS